MLTYQNYLIYASVSFYLTSKIVAHLVAATLALVSMHRKREPTLTSIPECEEDQKTKWVPKKRHDVLKAKYKCLKKLFQIYDANLMGALPERDRDLLEAECCAGVHGDGSAAEGSPRRRRSHRTKTDACAGTSDQSSGNVSLKSESGAAESIDDGSRCESSVKSSTKLNRTASTSTGDASVDKSEMTQRPERLLQPYFYYDERPRLTRFQCFLQRLFGLRHKQFVLPNGHIFAASDNNILHSYGARRRRRGIRFRRRRPKKVMSEGMLECKRPAILNFVQNVQKNCLLDTTPRQCPIVGCKMMFYGIINYNDHLNLCHFTERKYICHYCHEGFETEQDKMLHENDHLGIPKLNIASPMSTYRHIQKPTTPHTDTKNTSQDVPQEKLKKIVSFFDKIVDNQRLEETERAKKGNYSESNLRSNRTCFTDSNDSSGTSQSEKRVCTCHRSKSNATRTTDLTLGDTVKCHICGETFDHRRQLSLHVDLEHRVHNKFSKFHSCAGIVSANRPKIGCVSENGTLKVESMASRSTLLQGDTVSMLSQDSAGDKSHSTLTYDPSTNIVYHASSTESVCKNKTFGDPAHKVRSYKWEPGTKIIHV